MSNLLSGIRGIYTISTPRLTIKPQRGEETLRHLCTAMQHRQMLPASLLVHATLEGTLPTTSSRKGIVRGHYGAVKSCTCRAA